MSSNVTSAVKCKEALFCGVNLVKDPDNMTDLEKKHLPVITAPKSVRKDECFEVAYLARMDFTARTTCPMMKVCVGLDHTYGKLQAFEHCNLHRT